MLVAVNSKRRKYEPKKWVCKEKEIMRRNRKAAEAREPMTGEDVLKRFRAMGLTIIDKRAKASEQQWVQ